MLSSVFMHQTDNGEENKNNLDIQSLMVLGLLYGKSTEQLDKYKIMYNLACRDCPTNAIIKEGNALE